jgi:hypothetical protein
VILEVRVQPDLKPVDLKPGTRVRVRQVINRREGPWVSETSGTVVSVKAEPSESWFAHSQDNKIWLRRLRLRKDDGELTTLTLDERSEITLLGAERTH